MNREAFQHQLERVEPKYWQALCEGQALLLVEDRSLEIGPSNAPNAIVITAPATDQDLTELRRSVLAEAETLLQEYYRTHPLTSAGFNRQVESLFNQLGPANFAAVPGEAPDYTLFVETGSVIAETRQSPRHRYGAYCELERPMQHEKLEQRVRQWLTSGEAYDHYLGMNVCRYNC